MAAKFKIQNPQKLLVPGLVALLVVAAFLVGSLLTKVSMLEKDGVPIKGTTAQQGDQAAAQPNPLTPVKADTLNIPSVTADDHIKGSKDAKLTWIEYSDLQCPFCQRIHPDLQKMLSEYQGKVRWVYRHYPYEELGHLEAEEAANASECAAELGGNDAFWEFVDDTFEKGPSSLGASSYKATAKLIGLNEESFSSCVASNKFVDKAMEQRRGAEAAGVRGTPGNFLLDDKGNAWIIEGALPYASIKQIVDGALAL